MHWKRKIYEMTFQANEKANAYFNRYKRGGLFSALGLVIFLMIEIIGNYHRQHNISFTIFYIVILLAGYTAFMLSVLRGNVLINRSIRRVEVIDGNIKIETFGSSLFGLFKKEPITQKIPGNMSEVGIVYKNKVGFNRNYTGDIYSISYASDEYLIESSFFDEFSSLKDALVNVTSSQS
jgi:hypothetical protein